VSVGRIKLGLCAAGHRRLL